MTKQKTAIRQLIELTKQSFDCNHDFKAHAFLTMAEKLESVNEQQIKDAFVKGRESSNDRVTENLKQQYSRKYFNETFEKS